MHLVLLEQTCDAHGETANGLLLGAHHAAEVNLNTAGGCGERQHLERSVARNALLMPYLPK